MSALLEETHASNIPKIGTLRTLLDYGEANSERGQIFNDTVRSFRKSYKTDTGVSGSNFHDWKSLEHRTELKNMTVCFLDERGYGEIFWSRGGSSDNDATKLDYTKDVKFITKTMMELFFRLNQQQYRNVKYKKKDSSAPRVAERLGRSNTDPIDVGSGSDEDDTGAFQPSSPATHRSHPGKLTQTASQQSKTSMELRPPSANDIGKRVAIKELEQLRKSSESSRPPKESDAPIPDEQPCEPDLLVSAAKRRKLDDFRSDGQSELHKPTERTPNGIPGPNIRFIRAIPKKSATKDQANKIRKFSYQVSSKTHEIEEATLSPNNNDSQVEPAGQLGDTDVTGESPTRRGTIRSRRERRSGQHREGSPSARQNWEALTDSEPLAPRPASSACKILPAHPESAPSTANTQNAAAAPTIAQPQSQTDSPSARPRVELNYTVILSREPNQEFEKWYPEGGKFSDKTLTQVIKEIPKLQPGAEIASLIFVLCAPDSSIKYKLNAGDESGFSLMKQRFNKHMGACLAKGGSGGGGAGLAVAGDRQGAGAAAALLLEMEIEPVYKEDRGQEQEPLSLDGGFDW